MKRRYTYDFNVVSVYLLGFGEVGKTTLRTTLKNRNTWSAMLYNIESMTLKKNEATECVEIDRRVQLGKTNIQLVDFGGQRHYHHSTHIFTRASRAIFVIVSNPEEEGYKEQVWYWLRLLNVKSKENIPEAFIVFSRRDRFGDREKEQEMEEFIINLKTTFSEKININYWVWMDCTKTWTDGMLKFVAQLEESAIKIMKEVKVSIPDVDAPQKIIKKAEDLFYERTELEQYIEKGLFVDSAVASTWIDTLIKSHDLLSVRTNSIPPKDFICVDLQKFGKEILNLLISPTSTTYIYTDSELKGFYLFYVI